MKIKLKGNISQVDRISGTAKITLNLEGNAETTSLEAKKVSMKCVLLLKTLVADEVKLGSVIYVTVSDSEE
jgi:hypothetical protein